MIAVEVARRLAALHDLRARVDWEIRQAETQLRADRRKANNGCRPTRRQWIEHGTNAGYQWHVRHGLPFADDHDCGCREAHAAYMALATRRRTAARRMA